MESTKTVVIHMDVDNGFDPSELACIQDILRYALSNYAGYQYDKLSGIGHDEEIIKYAKVASIMSANAGHTSISQHTTHFIPGGIRVVEDKEGPDIYRNTPKCQCGEYLTDGTCVKCMYGTFESMF